MNRFVAFLSLVLIAIVSSAEAIDYPSQLGRGLASSQPYNLIGQLFFANGGSDYIGSGIVIRPRSILTAGHNLYDPDNGWSTDVLFRRGAYGSTVLAERRASRLFLLGGYRQNATHFGTSSIRTFASDTGGVLFARPAAGGLSAPWTANPSLLTNDSQYKIAVGYGAENHSGDYPLFVVPDRSFSPTLGSFYESRGAMFEGGMSGGPVFALVGKQYYVTGIVVSGSDYPFPEGGIRVIDTVSANFIWRYLR